MSPLNFSRRQVLAAAGATLLAGGVRRWRSRPPAHADTGYSPTVYYKIKNMASGRLLSVRAVAPTTATTTSSTTT